MTQLLKKGSPFVWTEIAYTSRTLSDSERKFDTYEKEALTIVYSVQHFRPEWKKNEKLSKIKLYMCLCLEEKEADQKRIH